MAVNDADAGGIPQPLRRWMAAVETPDAVRIEYDRRLDMVAITLGEPQPALSVELGDGAIARVDLRTHEVIGLEIYDCRAVFLPNHPEFELSYRLLTSHLWRWGIRALSWISRGSRSSEPMVKADTTLRATLFVMKQLPLVA